MLASRYKSTVRMSIGALFSLHGVGLLVFAVGTLFADEFQYERLLVYSALGLPAIAVAIGLFTAAKWTFAAFSVWAALFMMALAVAAAVATPWTTKLFVALAGMAVVVTFGLAVTKAV
jgi:hypothetical protein